ncbi:MULTISPECIES: helix-turn-helix domain-containing protein [Rahnella]|uniref:Helix-turn-helix domain-containing protein n=1 Tax=Rahnella laticis TaxID=2787622 RepID=A0ABS0E148_9GAMM|nr:MULTISPECIES: helix-turn-helix domain-containing protein [Rahnella]MBF7978832.1 helix-turn-helix domain-containing protein [Rahnella laticis]MBF7998922.1 helix-turn-helix domain-containing protein [Rahnella sp. LAC-M12]
MNNSKSVATLKPVTHIQILQESLAGASKKLKAKPGQRFQLIQSGTKMCFLLFQGKCDVKRYGDSLILGSIESPSMMGISELIPDPSNVFIQATTQIEYIYLPLEEVLQHVDEHDLWKSVSYFLMHVCSRFNEYLKTNSGISTYALICNLLRALNDEDFETRATVPAARYILDRTPMSRSGVMKVLSNLNKGGYIVIKRGLLIRINELPADY